ncbi:allergen Tha p 1-like [Pararge aegeria]|nr:allergen Tha p 1-like [Pararge aegeria]
MMASCFCKIFMMSIKHMIVLFLFTYVALINGAKISLETLDIEQLLSNEEQRKSAFACLMDQKPCGEMQGLRDTIPELIRTKCGDCSPKQKMKFDHISKVLLEAQPVIFNALVLKYSAKDNSYE